MEKVPRLSAFVGRSFLDEDKSVWHELRDILDSLKSMEFEYEDAKEAQIRPISEKVKELIIRHEIYIGVLTKRYPIWQAPASWHERWLYPLGSYVPQKWTTSEWVTEEIGFAIGKDRKVLLLIEKDVNFPTTDLDGDTQWVHFSRTNLSASHSEISQMILNLISHRVVSIEEPTSVATVAPSGPEKITEQQEPSFFDQLQAIKKAVLVGDYSEADRIQEEALRSETVAKERQSWEPFILGIRARRGDTDALSRLKRKCADDPRHSDAIEALANVYSSFDQFNQATDLLVSHLEKVPDDKRSMLAIKASEALCNDGKATEAISLLLENFKKESSESAHVALYRELARAGGKANLPDIETAFLEKVLKITPSDNDSRFRLAVVYSKNNLEQLAAHHYELLVTHTDWPGASNNLGVAYGELGFKANQFKLFKAVSEKYPLAKANLASLYATAGSLAEAETLAKAALLPPHDDGDNLLAINRARYVLNEIEATKNKEREAIGKIAEDTKSEREFMCAYAEAYCASSLPNDKGIFSTTHGDLALVRETVNLKGEGTFTKTTTTHRGILAAFMSDNISLPSGPEVKTYSISLLAKLRGQSGTFELKTSQRETPSTLLTGSDGIITGLMYFQDNGNVIQFLERDGKKRTIVSAHRKR